MSEKEQLQQAVAGQLRQFLVANAMRQTRERYTILRAAYDTEGIFTIEDLQKKMQEMRFHVSTGTIYQAVQLFVQANLLIRHPFSSSSATFERIADDRPHSYQICSNCHHITRIKSKEFAANLLTYRPRRFCVTHRVAYVYGICPKCEKKLKMQK